MGYGLLDRSMLQRLTERRERSVIGVIVLHMTADAEAAQGAIRDWMENQPRLVWRYHMDRDWFFFLQFDPVGDRPELQVDRAAAALKLRLERSGATALPGKRKPVYTVATASAYPSVAGRSAEAVIYGAVREALVNVIRRHRGDLAAAAAETPFSVLPEGEEYDRGSGDGDLSYTIGALAKPIPTFSIDVKVSEAARLFETNRRFQGAVIVHQERPVGLVMKEKLHQRLAGQYGLPLYWNRSIDKMMDDTALIVDAGMPVEKVAEMAMAREISRLYDIVVVTRDDRLLGGASIRSILESMTKLRTEEARTANPLTGLPGNAAIHREMKRRLDSAKPFSIIYADMDYFKWFNDCFGFSQGDEVIRYLASVLQASVRLAGVAGDFVGHVGGDDFIVLSQAEEPDRLCRLMIDRFEAGIGAYYAGGDSGQVTDREGRRVDQEGVSLSLSVVQWDGDIPVTAADVSRAVARLKKDAKSIRGSVWVRGDMMEKHPGEGRLQT